MQNHAIDSGMFFRKNTKSILRRGTNIKVLRRLRIRRRLKHLFREVMNNRYWLQEDNVQIGDDVKQNVRMIVQRRKELQGGLTLADKTIMRKKIEDRTDVEKEILFNSIGGLKCFRQWPENVKYQLVCSTYFVYYGPNRIIVKQDRYAEALYCIITGEIEIVQTYFDEVLREDVTNTTGKLGPGSIFGDVSLLVNRPLPYTLRTLTDCQLLKVNKENFNDTLKNTLKGIWDEIKQGLVNFPYFYGLSVDDKTEICTLSTFLQYAPNKIVYSFQEKKFATAYFVFEGRCRVIEKMYIRERKVADRILYSKYTPSTELRLKSNLVFYRGNIKSSRKLTDVRKEQIKKEIYSKCPAVRGLLHKFSATTTEHRQLFETESQNSLLLPENVKCHFIEVCTLNKQACFFENEIFDNRYIISETKMKILCIPMHWLLNEKHNRGNIWDRLMKYMKKLVPSSDEVFQNFVRDQRWLSYRKKLFKLTLGRKEDFTTTLRSDVPFSLRINEVYDVDD